MEVGERLVSEIRDKKRARELFAPFEIREIEVTFGKLF